MNEDYQARAEGIAKSMYSGSKLATEAGKKASLDMAKLVANTNSKSQEARALALEHNATYIGIGYGFTKTLIPIISTMQQELIGTGCDEDTAEVLTDIYVGKVFKNIIAEFSEQVED